jgi:capsular polysaccharide biosynthesis protein
MNASNVKKRRYKNSGIDIRQLGYAVIRNIIPILIISFIFGCLGFGYSRYKRTTTYTAKAKIIVNSPNGIDQPGVSAKAQAQAVEAVLTNRNLMKSALTNIKKKDQNKLLDSIKVKDDKDDQSGGYTHVLSITLTSDDHKIIKTATNKLFNQTNRILSDNLNTVDSVEYSPFKISENTSPSGKKYGVAFAAFGFLLSVLYIIVRELLNTSYYSKDVLEYETGVPVVGTIPSVQLSDKVDASQKGEK